MTITTVYRDGHAVAIDLDTTVGFNLPPTIDTPTQAVNVTRLRADDPATERLAFAVLSETGEQPLSSIDPDQTAVIDALQARFNRFTADDRPRYEGRHHRPGLLVRLFRALFGRRDGA